MAKISQPFYELNASRPSEIFFIEEIFRAYSRQNGKFVPIGWHVIWNDGEQRVILDEDVMSFEEAMEIYSR